MRIKDSKAKQFISIRLGGACGRRKNTGQKEERKKNKTAGHEGRTCVSDKQAGKKRLAMTDDVYAEMFFYYKYMPLYCTLKDILNIKQSTMNSYFINITLVDSDPPDFHRTHCGVSQVASNGKLNVHGIQ